MYERQFINFDGISLRDPVAIIGLPGIASVGKIAVETLASVLHAQKVMDFFCDDFPPRVIVRDGISHFPKSSLYLYRAAPDEPHDVLILSGDFQPTSSQGVFEYADYVAKKLSYLGTKEAYALAAYEQGYEEFFAFYGEHGRARVYVTASSEEILERAMCCEGTIRFAYGAVNGANGVIPAWAHTMYGIESACFLGETLGMIKLDYRAAQRVLEVISSLTDLELDLSVLDDDAEKVREFLAWAQKEIAQRESEESDGERPPDRYIG